MGAFSTDLERRLVNEVAEAPRGVFVDLGDVVVHQLDHALLVLGDAAVEANDVGIVRSDDVGVTGEIGNKRAASHWYH